MFALHLFVHPFSRGKSTGTGFLSFLKRERFRPTNVPNHFLAFVVIKRSQMEKRKKHNTKSISLNPLITHLGSSNPHMTTIMWWGLHFERSASITIPSPGRKRSRMVMKQSSNVRVLLNGRLTLYNMLITLCMLGRFNVSKVYPIKKRF